MRRIDISRYGAHRRSGGCAKARLRVPERPDFGLAFYKMLWLVYQNQARTRREIISSVESNPLMRQILDFKRSFDPRAGHCWSDLHRMGLIQQWKNDSGKIIYFLPSAGFGKLDELPEDQKKLIGL